MYLLRGGGVGSGFQHVLGCDVFRGRVGGRFKKRKSVRRVV